MQNRPYAFTQQQGTEPNDELWHVVESDVLGHARDRAAAVDGQTPSRKSAIWVAGFGGILVYAAFLVADMADGALKNFLATVTVLLLAGVVLRLIWVLVPRDTPFEEGPVEVGPTERKAPGQVRSRREIRAEEAEEHRLADVAAAEAKRRQRERVLLLENRYYAVVEAHAAHEQDMLEVLSYPTLTDLSESTTQTLYRELVDAQSLHDEQVHDEAWSREFAAAVTDLELAWKVARQYAERIRISGFDAEERKRLSRAHALLTKALDEASSVAERQSFYEKAMELVGNLVVVPRPAAQAVAAKMRVAIS